MSRNYKFYRVDHANCPWPNIFVIRTPTRDLLAVANLLVAPSFKQEVTRAAQGWKYLGFL